MSMYAAVLLACWMGLAAEAQPALLGNPGFEVLGEGGLPEAWRYVDYGTGSQGQVVEPGAGESERCVAVECVGTKQRGAWQQKLRVAAGDGLRVRVRYRTALKAGSPGAAVRVTWLRKLEGWDFIGDRTEGLAAGEEWLQGEAAVIAPPETRAAAVELFNFWGNGTVWFDDVEATIMGEQEKLELARPRLDRPPTPTQMEYQPEDGATVGVNPPAFVWVPVERERYVVQWAREASFEEAEAVRGLDLSIYTPDKMLEPGQWFWRYGVEMGEEVAWSKARRFIVPADAPELPFDVAALVGNLPVGHPRLWVRAEELEQWRESLAGNEVFRRVLADADKQAQIEPATIPEPRPYTDEEKHKTAEWVKHWRDMRAAATTAGHRAWLLGLAYLGTGEARYAEAGRAWLMHVCSWDPAGTSSLQYNDEAGMPLVYSIPRAYDWLYPAMTEDERRGVRDVYRVRGGEAFRVLRGMPFHSNPYSSHPGRWINFLGEGATCFHGEIPEAAEWLDYILKCYRAVYPAWGRDDGGWAEGPNYWKSYLEHTFTWMFVARRALGFHVERRPFFRNTGYFKLYTNPPNSKSSPFGDSASESSPGSADRTVMWHLGELYREPVFKWYASQIEGGLAYPLQALFWGSDEVQAAPPVDLADGRLFPAIGVAAMHSALEDPTTDVMVLLKSSPYGSYSHSHADQNAFYVQAGGEPLFIDSGWYPWYSSPHHDQWTRETKAHNCVTYDGGQGQVKRSKAANGQITNFVAGPDFHYAVGNATAAYGGALRRFERQVLFARPGVVFVFDDLASEEPRRWEWWLHALEPMEVDQEAQAVTARSGEAGARCTLVWPERLSFEQTTGFEPPPENGKPDQSHCRATVAEGSREQQFLAAISVAMGEETAETARLEPGENCLAVRVSLDEGEIVAAFRTGEGEMRAGRIHGAARAIAGRYDGHGELVAGFVDGADGVRNGESLLLASTEPGTYSMRRLEGLVVLGAKADKDIELTVRMEERPRWVLVDGVAAGEERWLWEDGRLTVSLSAGEHEVAAAWREGVQRPGPTGGVPVVVEGAGAAVLMAWRDYGSFSASGELGDVGLMTARPRVLLAKGQEPAPERVKLWVGDVLVDDWRQVRGALVARKRVTVATGAKLSLSVAGQGGGAAVRGLELGDVRRPSEPTRVAAMPEDGLVVEAEAFVDEGLGQVQISRGDHADQHGGASLYSNTGDGHWLEWEVDVPEEGEYDLFVRAACAEEHSLRELTVDGGAPAPGFRMIKFPGTGGWAHEADEWWALQVAGGTKELPALRLSAGRHRLRLTGKGPEHLNLDHWVLRRR